MSTENTEQKPNLYPRNGEITFAVPSTNAISQLSKAEKGRNVTAKYMTIQDWEDAKGKEQKVFFLGFKEATDAKGDLYYLAKFHDGKTPFVAGQTVLVQSLANVPVGQGVSVTCTDVVKNSKNGKTALFEIVELDINLMGRDE